MALEIIYKNETRPVESAVISLPGRDSIKLVHANGEIRVYAVDTRTGTWFYRMNIVDSAVDDFIAGINAVRDS